MYVGSVLDSYAQVEANSDLVIVFWITLYFISSEII